jgi:hypothetical protein
MNQSTTIYTKKKNNNLKSKNGTSIEIHIYTKIASKEKSKIKKKEKNV